MRAGFGLFAARRPPAQKNDGRPPQEPAGPPRKSLLKELLAPIGVALALIVKFAAKLKFFILPAIMAGAMFVQYKLNPAPPDPVQAKVFMVMPLVMSVMFAFFPAGLVLYWVTNTVLSIAQQWNINRRIAAQVAKKS